MTSIAELILKTRLGKAIKDSLAAQLSASRVHEDENTFFPGANMSGLYRDRYDYDRQTILAECLKAWRMNPIARRVVKLISMFVVGEGIAIQSDHPATHEYLQTWWEHPLNQLGRKCISFCDEATRSGNLFFLCTVDQNTGMLYVRGVPADQVEEIVSAPNDIDQELAYQPIVGADGVRPPWPAYDRTNTQPLFMLHYAYNQPLGVPWGEPDLAPMLPWFGRYASWLEDRARLNRFRQAFIFVVNGKFADRAAQDARQRELNYTPPPPGSILVTDENETWSVLAPELELVRGRGGWAGAQENDRDRSWHPAALPGRTRIEHPYHRRSRRHTHFQGSRADSSFLPGYPGRNCNDRGRPSQAL